MTSSRNLNGKTSRLIAAIAGAAILFSGAPTALANPGGGPGMTPMPSGPRVNPAESYREGLQALQDDDCRKAERKFGEVLRAARDMPEANYYMGLAKVCNGKDKASIRYFERAIKERDNFVEAREQLALVYVRLGETEDAQEQLDALKQIQADCQSNGCGLGVEGRASLAITTIEAAMAGGDAEDNEDDEDVSAAPDARNFAGLFFAPREAGVGRYMDAVKLINQERFAEAIEELYKSQSVIGPHPDIYNYLGFANRKLGRFDEAKSYYAAALKLAPDHRGATEYLGELYLELGQIDKAEKQLARLEELCDFGCAEYEELARLIEIKQSVRRATR